MSHVTMYVVPGHIATIHHIVWVIAGIKSGTDTGGSTDVSAPNMPGSENMSLSRLTKEAVGKNRFSY